MTNREFFKEQILDLVCKGKSLAFDVMTNKVCDCHDTSCHNCLFSRNSEGCVNGIEKWSNAEYVEPCPFERDELVEVSGDKKLWNLRYFSHKTADGGYYAYCGGKKSSETKDATRWNYCRKYGTLGGLVKGE